MDADDLLKLKVSKILGNKSEEEIKKFFKIMKEISSLQYEIKGFENQEGVWMQIFKYSLLMLGFMLFITLRVYGGFSTNEIEPEPWWGVSQCSIAYGDYDNDGDLDLAVAGWDSSVRVLKIYKNNGNGTFDFNEVELDPGWGVEYCSLAWGDYDNDGDLDFIAKGMEENRNRIYENV